MSGEEMPHFLKLNLDHLWIRPLIIRVMEVLISLCFCLFIYNLYLTYFHLRLKGSDNKYLKWTSKIKNNRKEEGKMYFKLQTDTVIKIGRRFNCKHYTDFRNKFMSKICTWGSLKNMMTIFLAVFWLQMQLCVCVCVRLEGSYISSDLPRNPFCLLSLWEDGAGGRGGGGGVRDWIQADVPIELWVAGNKNCFW